MSDIEKPIADEQTVLKGENQVVIESGDGRVGKCDVLVNGHKQTFDTGKEITVSDAQLDVLRNSGRNVIEVKTSPSTKKADKASPDGEAGAGGRSLAPATNTKAKATGKAAAKKTATQPAASNVNNGGNTTTATDAKADGGDDKK